MKKWHYFLVAAVIISQSHQLCKFHLDALNNKDYDYVDENVTDFFNKKSSIICTNISAISDVYQHVNFSLHNRYLEVTSSHIPTIAPQAFNSFPELIKLYLSNIHIKTLLEGAFDNLTQLEELHLDHNEIDEVKNQVLNELHRLKVLNLGNNRIVTVNGAAFLGLDNLKVLNLSNNRITILEEELLVEQRRLEELDLSGNPITNIIDNILPTSLEKLYLMDTSLSELSFNISHLRLNILNLKRNHISKIDCALLPAAKDLLDLSENKISTLINLEFLRTSQLNLNYNNLRVMDGLFPTTLGDIRISANKLKTLEPLFNKSRTLSYLDVSSNEISAINLNAFEGLSGLYSLKLNNNNITSVEATCFKDLRMLNKLNLSHNFIEQIKFGTFGFLRNMETLDLSYNKLTLLDLDVFHSSLQLRELYFDNNQISSLNIEEKGPVVTTLRLISLDKNSFSCQSLIKLDHHFKHHGSVIKHGTSYDGHNFHGISCIHNETYDLSMSSKVLQKVINDSVKNSNFEIFFDNEFNRTIFVQFFEDGYRSSNFFQSLNEGCSDTVLIFSTVIQTIASILLLVLIGLMYLYFKKVKVSYKSDSSSLI